MNRLALATPVLLPLLLAGCGKDAPAAAHVASAPAPSPAAPVTVETIATDPLVGRWYVTMGDTPWIALRLQVDKGSDGLQASWISFDWSSSPDPDHLARASKAVAVELEGEPPALSLQGPAPMLSDDGLPNGQRGRWTLQLHATPDGPRRLAGVAVHDEITGPAGTPVEMTREWRAWKRP